MKLSSEIKSIFENKNESTFGDFLHKIQHKGFGVLLVILSLPSALPVPAPGYSIPFGIVLFLIGIQLVGGKKKVWFPDKIKNKKLPASSGKLINGMIGFLKFFENFIRPRLRFLTKGVMYKLVGLIVTLCAVSMMIPIPLTNTIPAFGIFLIGLGLLEEDGLVILLGILACLIGLSLTSTILYFFIVLGSEGIQIVQDNYDMVTDSIKNWVKNLV